VGVTRRCNFLAKPRLRPLRPQDQANVHVTCTMSRLQRIARDPREPPHIGGPTALRDRHLQLRAAEEDDGQEAPSKASAIHSSMQQCHTSHTKILRQKNRRERELEPQLTLGAPRSQTRQRGCDHANQDRPWPLSKCKALLALLSLDGHSHGGKRKVNLNRATTQAKREHKNQFENLCAILEMVNSKS